MDRPRPSRSPLLTQRLVALALLAALLFTVPLLMPWLQGAPLAGWPRWAWALLGLWAVLIGLLALLMERSADEGAPP